jgi:sRNA-binding carbon storage regulator CsrA
MLVLSRRENDVTYLHLDEIAPGTPPIRVVIVEFKLDEGRAPAVRLGFDADPRISIQRDDIKLKHCQS